MIVKDEEEVLARCLNCVQPFADEIIIADTGSSDNTIKIARTFTDKVYPFEWCDDFSAARNFSFSKAGCELVMWLDADDVISDADAQKIAALKEEMCGYDVAFLLYAAAFDGERPTFTYYRERIFRRSFGLKWQGAVFRCDGYAQKSKAVAAHAQSAYLPGADITGQKTVRQGKILLRKGVVL